MAARGFISSSPCIWDRFTKLGQILFCIYLFSRDVNRVRKLGVSWVLKIYQTEPYTCTCSTDLRVPFFEVNFLFHYIKKSFYFSRVTTFGKCAYHIFLYVIGHNNSYHGDPNTTIQKSGESWPQPSRMDACVFQVLGQCKVTERISTEGTFSQTRPLQVLFGACRKCTRGRLFH